MLQYEKIDVSEEIGTSASKEYMLCHYWYLMDIGFITNITTCL